MWGGGLYPQVRIYLVQEGFVRIEQAGFAPEKFSVDFCLERKFKDVYAFFLSIAGAGIHPVEIVQAAGRG